MNITYDQQTIGLITMFEKLTGTSVKNCHKDSSIVFIVKEGDIGKAIGKNGKNVQRLTNIIKKPIRIVEYSEDPVQFVKNLTRNTNSKIYKAESGEIIIEPATSKDKGIIFGRDKKNLKYLQDLVAQHHKTTLTVK